MKQYRPARGRRTVNRKRVAIVSAVMAAAVVAIIFCVYMFSGVTLTPENEQELLSSGTFLEGVSVGGEDVGGLTYAQGEEKIKARVDKMLGDQKIEFTIKDDDHTYALADMGISVPYEDQLKAAMLYGREGTRWDLQFKKAESADFPLSYTMDESVMNTLIDTESANWGTAAQAASYAVQKDDSENDLTTGGTIVKQEAQDGWSVNIDGIKQTIKDQVSAQKFEKFDAETQVVKAEVSNSEENLVLMGTATTTISSSSSSGRKYNIWKMSDILNGAVIKPGETFSINDTAGDRTEKDGWKLAPGIENGTYTDQAGGGVCQVSSTMYNAALKAEMDIVARVPHTIMAHYTPAGMDATISSGGPDFKVSNPYDGDMVMIIKCNIPDSKITVELYGPVNRDYYLKFEPVLDSEDPLPATKYKTNSSLDKYELKRTVVGQTGAHYTIYAQKYDKDTDAAIGDKYKVTTSNYAAIAPVVELGSGIPMPADGTDLATVQAQAAELKAAEAAKNNPQASASASASSSPSAGASASVDPVTDPSTQPSA